MFKQLITRKFRAKSDYQLLTDQIVINQAERYILMANRHWAQLTKETPLISVGQFKETVLVWRQALVIYKNHQEWSKGEQLALTIAQFAQQQTKLVAQLNNKAQNKFRQYYQIAGYWLMQAANFSNHHEMFNNLADKDSPNISGKSSPNNQDLSTENFQTTIAHLQKAAQLHLAGHYHEEACQCYWQMAKLYRHRACFSLALTNYQAALANYQSRQQDKMVITLQMEISLLHLTTDKPEEALAIYHSLILDYAYDTRFVQALNTIYLYMIFCYFYLYELAELQIKLRNFDQQFAEVGQTAERQLVTLLITAIKQKDLTAYQNQVINYIHQKHPPAIIKRMLAEISAKWF